MFEEMIFVDIIMDWSLMEDKDYRKDSVLLLINRFENRHGFFFNPSLQDRMTQRITAFIESETARRKANVSPIRPGISPNPAPQAGQKETKTNGNANVISRAYAFINQTPKWH